MKSNGFAASVLLYAPQTNGIQEESWQTIKQLVRIPLAVVLRRQTANTVVRHVKARATLLNLIAIAVIRIAPETSESGNGFVTARRGVARRPFSLPTCELKKLRRQLWPRAFVFVLEENESLFPVLTPNALQPLDQMVF